MAEGGTHQLKADLTGQRIRKLPPALTEQHCAATSIVLDQNSISKLDNLDCLSNLQQLSASFNRLVRIQGLDSLHLLTALSLPNNSIVAIEGLENLTHLLWLNLSGNSIKTIEKLDHNLQLKHLDLSDNAIGQVGILTHLTSLKTLLLHGNAISSIEGVGKQLSCSLQILSLAENEVANLTEVSCLKELDQLEQLSLMNNPCLSYHQLTHHSDAYRSYVLSCCPSLQVLDGKKVESTDREKSSWLSKDAQLTRFGKGQSQRLMDHAAELLTSFAAGKAAGQLASSSAKQATQLVIPASALPKRQLEAAVLVASAVQRRTPLHVDRDGNHVAAVIVDRRPVRPLLAGSGGDTPMVPLHGTRASPPPPLLSSDRSSAASSPVVSRRSPSSSQAIRVSALERSPSMNQKTMSPVRSLSPARPTTRDKGEGAAARDAKADLQKALLHRLPNVEATGSPSSQTAKESAAAVKIQACWRGYSCRNFDGRVANVKRDLRIQRLEEHLTAMLFEMQRRHELALEEERLRTIQMDIMVSLAAKVKQLEAVIEELRK